MVIVIIDQWVYRIRQDGIVESAPAYVSMAVVGENGPRILSEGGWEARSAEATGLTVNEAWVIRENLKQLTGDFPSNRVPLPAKVEEREPAIAGSNLR